jgi:hypothetical protein
MSVPTELRARIEADYEPVRPLPAPRVRAISLLPLAALALLAAPTFFNVRSDAERIGWLLTWGASLGQVALGFIVITAALRESIPGRAWSTAALAAWIVIPFVLLTAITFTTSELSQISLQRGWWLVGLVCVGGSAATALPIVALANVLAARAYPTRPASAGLLLGVGAGLMADAGWRLFCHFGEPSHVLTAHVGGVVLAALSSAALAIRLNQDTTSESLGGVRL